MFLLNRQTIRISFRIVDGKEQGTPGHNQTNYDRWKITNTPYSVSAYVDVIPLLSLLKVGFIETPFGATNGYLCSVVGQACWFMSQSTYMFQSILQRSCAINSLMNELTRSYIYR